MNLIAIGTHMPRWVAAGFIEYQKRLPKEYKLNLIEITQSQRTKNSNTAQLIAAEGKKILATIPKQSHVIALDEKGELWNTKQLAEKLQKWQLEAPDISFLIGGPDGLSISCLKHAAHTWSVSPLTLPHMLVRTIVAEQLYRAWSLLKKHPYHRE